MAIKNLRLDGEVYNLTTNEGDSTNKVIAIYETLNGEDDLTKLNITITAEQATEIRKDLEHTILKLYNASSSGLREVYFYYVETKYGNTYYHTIAQGKSYVLTTSMSTGSPNTVTIYELTGGITEEEVQTLIENETSTLATKTEVEAKQNKLTAGDNITIAEDGTISGVITDTAYVRDDTLVIQRGMTVVPSATGSETSERVLDLSPYQNLISNDDSFTLLIFMMLKVGSLYLSNVTTKETLPNDFQIIESPEKIVTLFQNSPEWYEAWATEETVAKLISGYYDSIILFNISAEGMSMKFEFHRLPMPSESPLYEITRSELMAITNYTKDQLLVYTFITAFLAVEDGIGLMTNGVNVVTSYAGGTTNE